MSIFKWTLLAAVSGFAVPALAEGWAPLVLKTNVSVEVETTSGKKHSVEKTSEFDHLVLNRTREDRYTSMFEFFERDGHLKGRFCMLTQTASFTDCVTVVPNLDDAKTCSVKPYDPAKDSPALRESSRYGNALAGAAGESKSIADQLKLFKFGRAGVPADVRFSSMNVESSAHAEKATSLSPAEVVRLRAVGTCQYFYESVAAEYGGWQNAAKTTRQDDRRSRKVRGAK